MAVLHVKSPNGTTHDMNLDNLDANSGAYESLWGWALFPNGMKISVYGQSGSYESPNAQHVVWAVHIPMVCFIGAFHLTTSGRPIMFSIANASSDGCTLVSWDCATPGYPSASPIFSYVLAIGW